MNLFSKPQVVHKVAQFLQVNMNDPRIHHDALEFPDGQLVIITRLEPRQRATLQLPAGTATPRRRANDACSQRTDMALVGGIRSKKTQTQGMGRGHKHKQDTQKTQDKAKTKADELGIFSVAERRDQLDAFNQSSGAPVLP
jgi:hypothetical protein